MTDAELLAMIDADAVRVLITYDQLVEYAIEGADDEPSPDAWWLGIARANLATAFLALRAAVNKSSAL